MFLVSDCFCVCVFDVFCLVFCLFCLLLCLYVFCFLFLCFLFCPLFFSFLFGYIHWSNFLLSFVNIHQSIRCPNFYLLQTVFHRKKAREESKKNRGTENK